MSHGRSRTRRSPAGDRRRAVGATTTAEPAALARSWRSSATRCGPACPPGAGGACCCRAPGALLFGWLGHRAPTRPPSGAFDVRGRAGPVRAGAAADLPGHRRRRARRRHPGRHVRLHVAVAGPLRRRSSSGGGSAGGWSRWSRWCRPWCWRRWWPASPRAAGADGDRRRGRLRRLHRAVRDDRCRWRGGRRCGPWRWCSSASGCSAAALSGIAQISPMWESQQVYAGLARRRRRLAAAARRHAQRLGRGRAAGGHPGRDARPRIVAAGAPAPDRGRRVALTALSLGARSGYVACGCRHGGPRAPQDEGDAGRSGADPPARARSGRSGCRGDRGGRRLPARSSRPDLRRRRHGDRRGAVGRTPALPDGRRRHAGGRPRDARAPGARRRPR